MSLLVHHGPHLGPLADALADLLADPLPDPFAAEVVSVPTAGVRDWLQRQLAMRLGATGSADGVVANIRMEFPGRFVAAALGQRLDEVDPWDVERLSWAVLAALADGSVDAPGSTLPGSVRARRIADLFDRYATNRPEIIQQWAAGHDGDGTTDANGAVVPLPPDQRWQPLLWRVVRSLVGTPSRAERLPDLLADLRAGVCEPQLPARVALFGVSTIAPGQLRVVRALADVRDVHLHLVHPSPAAWDGGRSLAGTLTPRATVDASSAVTHPLLRSWARPSMEAAALLRGCEAVFVDHPHPTLEPGPAGQLQLDLDLGVVAPPPVATGRPATALQRLQADILADRAPTPGPTGDPSLQIHACHGATRQLEVFRDALAHLFVADPSLQPDDVLVLCPDLARFAALAPAVFARGSLPVPLRVTDLTLGSQNVVATALTSVLALVAGRATAADVLALCGLDPVRVRFGITLDDLELYDRWVADLGTTWGLDGAHRSDWLSVDVVDGTWAATLDRVLVGAAMPAPEPRVAVGDVVPFDDVDAGGFEAAGKLADLIARLRTARATARGPRPISEWCEVLVALTTSLFETRAADAWQLAEVLSAIDDLRDRSVVDATPSNVALTLADVRALIGSAVAAPTGRLNLRSGAVTMTAMVPVRNLPARVLCIAGLDEGALRSSAIEGDDLLGTRPCVGEREPRTEGRHLLLAAVMAAEDHLLITCDGNDVTTNRALPLPVQLAELVDATFVQAPAEDAVVRHPSRAHDPRNFVPNGITPDSGPFSFDNCRLEGATIARATRSDSAQRRQWTPLTVLVPPAVTVTELAEASARPSRTYLHDRLEVRLPRERDAIVAQIPVTVTPLERYALGDDLLRSYRHEGFAATSVAATEWQAMRRLQGSLPPRELATAVLDEVDREVRGILDSRADLKSMLNTADRCIDIDIPLHAAPWAGDRTVSLCDRIESISGTTLVRVAFVRPKARGRLSAAIALAALVVAQPEERWQVLLATRSEASGLNKPPFVKALMPLAAHDAEAARRFLEVVLDLRLRALREPIPLFEFSRDVFRTRTLDDEVVERQMKDEADLFVWSGMTAHDLLMLAPEEGDPITDATARGASAPSRLVSFATHLWHAYDDFVSEQPAAAATP